MKNRGFTLIEILAVLTILSLIAMIVFPAINYIIKSSAQNAYEAQEQIIIKAAKEYFLDNVSELPEVGSDDTSKVDVATLVDGGYIVQDKVLDPRGKKPLSGHVLVEYKSKQYVYKYVDNN